MTATLDDHLLSAESLADPYPHLAALREQAPLHWSEADGAWMVLRHDAPPAVSGGELRSGRKVPNDMIRRMRRVGQPEIDDSCRVSTDNAIMRSNNRKIMLKFDIGPTCAYSDLRHETQSGGVHA